MALNLNCMHMLPHDVLRMQTDANQGGTEKLSICEMHSSFGVTPPFGLTSDDLAPECAGLLMPMAAFMVKGFTRSYCAFETPEFFNSMPQEVKAFLGYKRFAF